MKTYYKTIMIRVFLFNQQSGVRLAHQPGITHETDEPWAPEARESAILHAHRSTRRMRWAHL